MNKKDFKKSTRKLHIPDFLYNIDGTGRDDERFCLVRAGERWNVYYSERGKKTTDKYFDTESDGLEYILSELSE